MMKAVAMGAVLVISAGASIVGKAAVPAQDQRFAMNTARVGIAEVELGKLASEKANNPEVKSFAQRMVTDHSKANDELKALAQKQGITLPTEMDAKHKALRDRLMKSQGKRSITPTSSRWLTATARLSPRSARKLEPAR